MPKTETVFMEVSGGGQSLRDFILSESADGDYGYLGQSLADHAKKFKPRLAWHVQLGNNQVGGAAWSCAMTSSPSPAVRDMTGGIQMPGH